MNVFPLLITAPPGMENLLGNELRALEFAVDRCTPRGVFLSATSEQIHRLRLWSRFANRIWRVLASVPHATTESLRETVADCPWTALLSENEAIWIDGRGQYDSLRHAGYAAQVVKDGIFDALRRQGRNLPELDRDRAGHRMLVSVGKVTLVLQAMFHGSLHRRGWRQSGGAAPVKENLAALLLHRAGWPHRDGHLFDPCCGSGTFLIEGLMMAADIAPGLLAVELDRCDPGLSQDGRAACIAEAEARRAAGLAAWGGCIEGSDQSHSVIEEARANVDAAGLSEHIRLQVADARTAQPMALASRPPGPRGLLLCNPPYGERLGSAGEVRALYAALGSQWRQALPGWMVGVLVADPALERAFGLAPERVWSFLNGRLATRMLTFRIFDKSDDHPGSPADSPVEAELADGETGPALIPSGRPELSPGAQMLANRLRKNQRRLAGAVRKLGLQAWRLYDADLPEYAVAVDLYADHALVQEYAAPPTIPVAVAASRFREACRAVEAALDLPAGHLHTRRRVRQKGSSQYQREQQTGGELVIAEHGTRLLVRLEGYLDTGLFLDHRPTRLYIQQHAANGRFLNLFCYTGAASVHAAIGGARETLSIDMSATYLDWYARNLELNGLSSRALSAAPGASSSSGQHGQQSQHGQHGQQARHGSQGIRQGRRVREVGGRHWTLQTDVLRWLAEMPSKPGVENDPFDLIFLDPPTFSNSKRMDSVLEVQRDHEDLIDLAMRRLAPDGLLIFSTNYRRFRLAVSLSARYRIVDHTRESVPEDFQRGRPPHQCWHIRHRAQAT